jgi:hypothetical protein
VGGLTRYGLNVKPLCLPFTICDLYDIPPDGMSCLGYTDLLSDGGVVVTAYGSRVMVCIMINNALVTTVIYLVTTPSQAATRLTKRNY